MAEKINIGAKEPLYKAAEKINGAIDEVNTFQTQIDQLVIEGDSSVEAAQARVDAEGVAHTTLKERLDTEHSEVTAQLAQIAINVKHPPVPMVGAKVDGVTNDHTAIQNILDYVSANNSNGGEVLIPYGVSLITDTLIVPAGVTLKGFSDAWITGAVELRMDNLDDTKPVISIVQKSSTGIGNLKLTTVQPRQYAIYRENTSRYYDFNIYIQGDFRRGYYHFYNDLDHPTGGFYNNIERVVAVYDGDTYTDSKGFYFESYFSAAVLKRCDAHGFNTGMHIDFANAVHVDTPSMERNDLGIYIGTNSKGVTITAPYYEKNTVDIEVHPDAENVRSEFTRSSRLQQAAKHENNLMYDGGLTSYHQALGFENLIDDGIGAYYKNWVDESGDLTAWKGTAARAIRVTSNRNGFPSAIKAEVTTASLGARVETNIKLTPSRNNKNTSITVSGWYYVDPNNTGQTLISVKQNDNTILTYVHYADVKGVWTKFIFNVPLEQSTLYPLKLVVEPGYLRHVDGTNAPSPTVGDYVLVTGLQVNYGYLLSPKTELPKNDVIMVRDTYIERYSQTKRIKGFILLPKDQTSVVITYPDGIVFDRVVHATVTNRGGFTPVRIEANETQATIHIEYARSINEYYWFEVEGYIR